MRRLAEAAIRQRPLFDGALDRAELNALDAHDRLLPVAAPRRRLRPAVEQMLMGKPAIATAYSGNLDFMTADVSCLRRRRRSHDRDHGPYLRGYRWADPDLRDRGASHRGLGSNLYAADSGRARPLPRRRMASSDRSSRLMRAWPA